jgi:ABC-type branched-subunit amino acid transport system ATPase component
VLSFFDARLVGFRLDQLAYSLSYANRRRLEIARAMASEPTLLLLDEPTAGMNPHETEEMTALIGRLRDEKGYTILLIEHDMQVVRGVSDRVIVLDHGCKIAEGDYDDVTCDERVIEAYLGKEQPCGL